MTWTYLEEALLMELYHLTRDAGNPAGMTWNQLASTINLHITERNLDLTPRFTASNTRRNVCNHKEDLLKRWGSDWTKVALVAKKPRGGVVAAVTLLEIASKDKMMGLELNGPKNSASVSIAEEKAIRGSETAALDILAEVCVARLALEFPDKADHGG